MFWAAMWYIYIIKYYVIVKTWPEQRQETLLAVSDIFIDFQIKNSQSNEK